VKAYVYALYSSSEKINMLCISKFDIDYIGFSWIATSFFLRVSIYWIIIKRQTCEYIQIFYVVRMLQIYITYIIF